MYPHLGRLARECAYELTPPLCDEKPTADVQKGNRSRVSGRNSKMI